MTATRKKVMAKLQNYESDAKQSGALLRNGLITLLIAMLANLSAKVCMLEKKETNKQKIPL